MRISSQSQNIDGFVSRLDKLNPTLLNRVVSVPTFYSSQNHSNRQMLRNFLESIVKFAKKELQSIDIIFILIGKISIETVVDSSCLHHIAFINQLAKPKTSCLFDNAEYYMRSEFVTYLSDLFQSPRYFRLEVKAISLFKLENLYQLLSKDDAGNPTQELPATISLRANFDSGRQIMQDFFDQQRLETNY